MAQENADTVIKNIDEYVRQMQAAQPQRMDSDVDEHQLQEYEEKLDTTIIQLKEQVQRQQDELEELRRAANPPFSLSPAADPAERLRQLQTITAAYDELTPSRPLLPNPGSVIPSIIAADAVQRAATNSTAAIASMQARQESVAKQLAREESSLADAKLLSATLEARIVRLRAAEREQAQRSVADQAREQLKAQRRRARDYDAERERLRAQLDDFINGPLAAMLAAEELGGPVVGEMVDVDEEMLEAGFSSQGKPRKAGSKAAGVSEDRRQRRIDEIWGAAAVNNDDDEEEEREEPRSEREAAAAELRRLVDSLLAAAAGEGETGVYVRLQRDSAAARLLVRAKVAQFHPRDARRLRLVDFGRELDD